MGKGAGEEDVKKREGRGDEQRSNTKDSNSMEDGFGCKRRKSGRGKEEEMGEY